MTSSEVLKQPSPRFKFSLLVRIENFSSFVNSKAKCETKRVSVNDTEWCIKIEFYRYSQTDRDYILVTPSSPEQPEFFAAFVCGTRSDRKECSFAVDTILKFKRAAQKFRYSHKFSFDSTNHCDSRGYRNFVRIDVILLYHFFLSACQIFLCFCHSFDDKF